MSSLGSSWVDERVSFTTESEIRPWNSSQSTYPFRSPWDWYWIARKPQASDLGDFNAHIGSGSMTSKGLIGRNGLPGRNQSVGQFLDFCAGWSLFTTNTVFQHKVLHQRTWHEDGLSQRSMIDFGIVSSDLRPFLLDTWVRRGAELSTDYHLMVSWIRWQGRWMPHRTGGSKQLSEGFWE